MLCLLYVVLGCFVKFLVDPNTVFHDVCNVYVGLLYVMCVPFVALFYVVGSFPHIPAYNPSEISCPATDEPTSCHGPKETTSLPSPTPIITGDLSHDNTTLYAVIGLSLVVLIFIILIMTLTIIAIRIRFFRLAL